jgi:hypothetical protein
MENGLQMLIWALRIFGYAIWIDQHTSNIPRYDESYL